MRFETERLLLRPFRLQDREDVFAYCSQEGVGELAGWPAHRSLADTDRALAEWTKNEDMLAVVWKADGRVVGHLAANGDSEEGRADTRELGCAVNQAYQRRGIMTEAVQVLLEHLFSHGIEVVWACCFQENLPSRRMIEGCGFQFQQAGTFYAKGLDRRFDSYEYRMTGEQWRAIGRETLDKCRMI